MTASQLILTPDQMTQFERDGYFVARGLLSPDEAQQWCDHFMAIHARGTA